MVKVNYQEQGPDNTKPPVRTARKATGLSGKMAELPKDKNPMACLAFLFGRGGRGNTNVEKGVRKRVVWAEGLRGKDEFLRDKGVGYV